MRFFLFIALIISAFSGCQTTEIRENRGSKILFAHIRLKRDPIHKQVHAELVDTLMADGSIKSMTDWAAGPGMLKCSLLDENSHLLGEIFLQDPLDYFIEHPIDEENIGRTKISLDEAQLTIRVNFHPELKFLRIEKYFSSDSSVVWTKIKL